MHPESVRYMRECLDIHAADQPPGRVLDVGAWSPVGKFRQIWEGAGWDYVGLDMELRENVDVALEDPWLFPFEDASFDAVISGQMMEHNEFFWLSFMEMARVLKLGGLMIHIAPSRGRQHRAPQDCWRFYRDGMTAVARWSGCEIVEATTDWDPAHVAEYAAVNPRKAARLKKTLRTENTIWGDTVGVFRKVVETRHALGTSYMRQLADRAEGGTGAPKAKPKPKAKTAKKPVAAVRKKAG